MRGLAVFAFALAFAGTTVCAQTPDRTTAESRRLVQAYARLLYIEHKPQEAFARFFAPDIIQHDPEIGDGIVGEQAFLQARQHAHPDRFLPVEQFATVVDNILADDDFVAVKSHTFTNPADKGRVFVDIWRIAQGRFAEHWGVIQPTPDHAENDATMWCRAGTTYAEARALSDTVAMPTCGAAGDAAARNAALATVKAYTTMLVQPGRAALAVETWVADGFVQHSPHIAPGKAALAQHLVAGYDHADTVGRVLQVGRVLADGELVLVHRRVATRENPRGTAFADLFRVRAGLIIEHWDVAQAIPDFSVAGHAMVGDTLEPGRRVGAPAN